VLTISLNIVVTEDAPAGNVPRASLAECLVRRLGRSHGSYFSRVSSWPHVL
jgi:hypothetical protein